MHLRVLKSPARVPQANTFCERLIGTARRCLDHLIPLHERHLRKILPSGYLTTIAGVRTRASGPVFPTTLLSLRCYGAIGFLTVIASSRSRSSAACITNIVWSESRRDAA